MNILLLAVFLPAYALGHYLVVNDPGPKEPRSALRTAVGFGLLSITLAVLFSFIVDRTIYAGEPDPFLLIVRDAELTAHSFMNIVWHAFGEEVAKFVPLAIYIYHKRYFNELSDGIIYFALVGLTFGALETLEYAAASAGLATVMLRFALTLFLHAATTAIVGYALAARKLHNISPVWIGGTLIFVTLMHAIYNAGVTMAQVDSAYVLLAVAVSFVLNGLLFGIHFRAAREDVQDHYKAMLGATAVSRLTL